MTDWRAVYAAIAVIVMLLAGGTAWTFYTPLDASVTVAQTSPVANHPLVDTTVPSLGELGTVEVQLPWAQLPQERRLPPDTEEYPSEVEVADDSGKTDLDSEISQDSTQIVDNNILNKGHVYTEELEQAVTLDFNPHTKTTPRRSNTVRATSDPLTQSQQFAMLSNQDDLAGLPILGEDECHSPAANVKELAFISKHVGELSRRSRRTFGLSESMSLSGSSELEVGVFKVASESSNDATTVGPLVQMLQAENTAVRMTLVAVLSQIEGHEASLALADRAIFDLSPMVRNAAIAELRFRPAEDYRPRLLAAFRYPWPGAAFNAAEALIQLADSGVLPQLEELLDKRDPSEPVETPDGRWQRTELVRVNHLRNCMLCHPQSSSRSDPIRGVIPTPGRPLRQAYYQTRSGSAVRADVTYLRQDFSVMQQVADPGPWPSLQRFDFLTRTRQLTEKEVEEHECLKLDYSSEAASYPQREAVLLAIQGLAKSKQ